MPTQQEILISAYRQEMEDMFSAMETRFYLNHGTPYDDQGTQFVDDGVPYLTTAEVLTMIPVSMRKDYRTVNVLGVDYWFVGGALVLKNASMVIADNSVTLAKLVNMATASFVGRKTAGAGVPEVLSVDDVKTLLGISALNLSLYVLKANGYSLVLDTEIAKIHAAESDNQDLQPILDAITDLQNALSSISSDSATNVFDIVLPASDVVAIRCLAPTVLPDGWTVAAGTTPTDLVITHGLARRIASVTVFSVDGVIESQLPYNGAYAGIVANTTSILTIQGLATIVTPIVIHLIFA